MKSEKLYYLINFCDNFFFSLATVTYGVYAVRHGQLEAYQLILIGTAMELAVFMAEVPTGIMADRYSRKGSILIGLFVMSASIAIVGLSPTFTGIGLGMFSWGIGYSFISGAQEAWLSDEIGETKANKAFIKAAQWQMAGGVLSIIPSIVLAGINPRLPFITAAFFYASLMFFLLGHMPEKGFIRRASSMKGSVSILPEGFWSRLKTNHLMFIGIVTSVCIGVTMETSMRFMPHIMLNLQDMPNIPFMNYFTFGMTGDAESSELGWFGIIKGGGYLAALFGTFLVGKVVKTERLLSVSRALTFSTLILGLSALVFGAANGFLLALFSYWLLIAVEESMYPLRVAFVNRGVQSSERATLISIISQSSSFGEMSAGPIMAIISVARSVSFALITSAGASVSASLLFAKSSFPLKENEG